MLQSLIINFFPLLILAEIVDSTELTLTDIEKPGEMQ